MSAVNYKVGDDVDLSIQMSDGAENLFPQVKLRDAAGVLLATLDLAHVADGLYKNTGFSMPNTSSVTAQYVIFSDAGRTVQDTNYEETLDVFVRDTESSGGSSSYSEFSLVLDDDDEQFTVQFNDC